MDKFSAAEEAYKNGKEAAARKIVAMIQDSARYGQINAEALIERIKVEFKLNKEEKSTE